MTIWFDMDGTISNLYLVTNWHYMLRHENPKPYRIALPIGNMRMLARYLNILQKQGHKIGIISWLSKGSTVAYDRKVTAAKLNWLKQHLNSVQWDYIHIVEYGTNKWDVCGDGILFDDNEMIRADWGGTAYEPAKIMEVLKTLKEA